MIFQNYVIQFVLEEMFQSATPLLESVWHNEPPVQELQNTIKNAMEKALIPLKSYAKEYEKFLQLNELDIGNYIKSVFFYHIYSDEYKLLIMFILQGIVCIH